MGPTRLLLGDLLGHATALGHLVQGFKNIGSEDDHAAWTPRCAAAFGCVAEHLHRSTGERYFLQLSRGEESNVLAIGRPEGKSWPLDLHLVQPAGGNIANPQPCVGRVPGE